MATYSVFEPPSRNGVRAADRIAFIRDGFSWGAFFLGPLWMLWRRLWLVFIGIAALLVAVEIGMQLATVPFGARAVVAFLIALLLGLEGASLRRWTLRRRGWSDHGIVIAGDREAAERRFFDAWAQGRTAANTPSRPAVAVRPAGAASDVVGLFPEPGLRR
jgi:hypothetical protein